MKNSIRSNFDMLRAFEPQLWRLGALAERYFAEDPNDEPASALLARNASSNTAVAGKNMRATQRVVLGGGGRRLKFPRIHHPIYLIEEVLFDR